MPSDPPSTRLPTRGGEPSEATTFDHLERTLGPGGTGCAGHGSNGSIEPVTPLGEGEIINGRYRVEAYLGQGGMGVVYRVADSLNDSRQLALKTIRGDLIRPARIGQFKTEFRTMTLLRHPNLAQAYDFDRMQKSEDHFFTMEFVPGHDALRATDGAGWREVVDILVQVCRALSYVHSRRIIHYDLKPANVLVDDKGRAKVLDLGVAGRTLIGAPIRGTPHYMAPELTDPEAAVDHRVDLYSLGMMAYQLLCRRVAFETDTLSELLQMHHLAGLEFDEPCQKAIPAWLRSVVERLCAKQPADRYPTANAVIEAINREGGLQYEPETLETRESYVLSSRFVGRSAEYGRLNEFISQRVQGQRQSPPVLLVAGQSGTGKSRLVREVRYHSQLSNIHFCEGRCFEGSFSELAPLVPILESMAWLAETSGRTDLIERHMPELAKVSPRLGRRHYTRPSPALPDAGKERTRLREHVIDFLGGVADAAPFVLFIDDLQWGGGGLTEILFQLAERISIRERLAEPVKMALLGAYREDEIEGRPLENLLAGLESKAAVERVALRPLESSHVADLLTSMLGVDELPEAFVARVMNETAGNPFFVEEVMRTLVEEGVVFLRDGVWAARDEVGDIEIPNTVAAVFRRRAEMLDENQRRLLETIALCGRPVAVGVLARTTGLGSEALHTALSVLTGRRMVLATPVGDELRYRVSHDRMRETLTADITAEERRAHHLRVARCLAETYADRLEDYLFEITDHYNAAAELVIEPDERAEVVGLNERAGRMAKLSGAFEAARRYFEFALEFLPDDSWVSDYAHTVEITRSILEVEFLAQDRERADEHFKLLVTHARTDLERASAYLLKIHALAHLGHAYEALAVTQECLPLLGVRMPARPRKLQVLAQLIRTKLALRGKSDHDLLRLPEREDGEKSTLLMLLSNATAPAFLTYQENLLAYHAAKAVQLAATYGSSQGVPTMYSMYSFILGEALDDSAGSRRFADLALARAVKHEGTQELGRVSFLLAGFVFPWTQPLSSTIRLLADGHETAMRAGDLLFAGFHLNVAITQQCMCSESLQDTLALMRKHEAFLLRLNNPHTITEMVSLTQMLKLFSGRAGRQVGGKAKDRFPFDEPGFQEDVFLEYLLELDDAIPIGFYYAFKLKSLFVMGLYQQAARLVEESERRVPATRGQYVFAEQLFYSFLVRAHEYSDPLGGGAGKRRTGERTLSTAQGKHGTDESTLRGSTRKRLKILTRKLRTMTGWADVCPENFRHKQLLMEAELARLHGQGEKAADLYKEAIARADEDGFPFNAALAAELAGRFHLGERRQPESRDLLLRSRAGYLAWGAGGKVDALDREFPDLL